MTIDLTEDEARLVYAALKEASSQWRRREMAEAIGRADTATFFRGWRRLLSALRAARGGQR